MKVVSCVRGGVIVFPWPVKSGTFEAVVYPAADVSGSSPLISTTP